MRKGEYHRDGKSEIQSGNERTDGKICAEGNMSATMVAKKFETDTNTGCRRERIQRSTSDADI